MHQYTPSDERLMKLSAEGDRSCFESLVRRYARPLMTLINRMTGKHHRSEDIFQEVLLSCWKNRRQYKFPKSFRPWIYRIAINQCRQVYRKKDMTISNQETSVEAKTVELSPETSSLQQEVDAAIKSAVENLPEHQRLCAYRLHTQHRRRRYWLDSRC